MRAECATLRALPLVRVFRDCIPSQPAPVSAVGYLNKKCYSQQLQIHIIEVQKRYDVGSCVVGRLDERESAVTRFACGAFYNEDRWVEKLKSYMYFVLH